MSCYYFGYGSNLDLDDLRRFEIEHFDSESFSDSLEVLDGIFFLPDYELEFPVFSASRNCGVLNVRKNLGHVVAGKLFKVDSLDVLNRKEGCSSSGTGFYDRVSVSVIDECGKIHDAITYVVSSEKNCYVEPSDDYVQFVLNGYQKYEISSKYPFAKNNLLNASKNQQTTPINSVFIYGTLLEGESREHHMSQFSVQKIKTKISAKMFDIGSYPAIILEPGIVHGELHQIEPVEELDTLDHIEGFDGYVSECLYYRVLINTENGLTWTYVWNGSVTNLNEIPNGDWKNRNNEKLN